VNVLFFLLLLGFFASLAKRLNPVGPESSRQIPDFGVEGATLVVK